MIPWLKGQLREIEVSLGGAFLFGSALQGIGSARDVDIVLVTADAAGGDEWGRVRSFRNALVPRFEDTFNIPLSVLVLTPSEWLEIDGSVVRERARLL